MLYQPLHILPQFTIQTMINGSETTFADMSGQQHIVKHLDAADLFTFLLTDGSVVMTSFNEHCTYACLVLSEASGLHKWDNAMSPECLVHANAISRYEKYLCLVANAKLTKSVYWHPFKQHYFA